jgi:hypothetical protein
LPDAVKQTGQGVDWLRYQTDHPFQANPLVIQYLVSNHIPIVGLSEVPRSLEKVYLQAINRAEENDPMLGLVKPSTSSGEIYHAG